MKRADEDRGPFDPDRLLQRLTERHRELRADAATARLECYHRRSISVRVTSARGYGATATRAGREDGVAVRLNGGDENATRFAACSGCGVEDLRWALATAKASAAGQNGAAGRPAGPVDLKDSDPDGRLPSPSELGAWLERARGRLEEEFVTSECWVEASITVECLVADGGVQAVRTRTRGWAMARMRSSEDAGQSSRPIFVASRAWRNLDPAAWSHLAATRRLPDSAHAGEVRHPIPVLFTPEASATVVSALARSLHITGGHAGAPVGPAWQVTDDPRAADSLFGGRFDDAGFETRRRTLADGIRIAEPLAGPGSFRRPSFRDPPRPLPSHLVLQPGGELTWDRGLVVSELAIHPFPAGDWVLECDGTLAGKEFERLRVRGGLVRITPSALVQRCAARIGEARPSHRGIVTPALLFDDLPVRL